MEEHKEYLSRVMDEINLMVAVISIDNTLISANKALLDFAHVTLEEIKGIAYWDLPWWQHSAELQNTLLFAIGDSYFGKASRFEASHSDYYGNVHEIDFIIKPVMKDGEAEYFIAMGYNVTDLVSARKELTQRDKQIKAFFEYSNEGYFFLSLPDTVNIKKLDDQMISKILDKCILSSKNERLEKIIQKDEITSENILEYIGFEKDNIIELWKTMILEGSINIQTEIVTKNNETKNLNVTIVAIYGSEGEYDGNFGIVRDITSEVERVKKISFFAEKDPLTGLNNRRNFFKEANILYERCKKENKPLYVAMLDIDFFKKVNDTYGHDAGDIVIKDVSSIINSDENINSVTGRYGGEEFVIVFSLERRQVLEYLNRIRIQIENNIFKYEQLDIKVTMSIGYSEIDFDSSKLENELSKADKALYVSKQNGRNRVTLFVDELHGPESIDKLTGLYIEKTILYNLKHSLYDALDKEDSIWVLYYSVDVLKEDMIINSNRHLLTMAMCITKSIRQTDNAGRYKDNGFIVILKDANKNVIKSISKMITNNIYLGFSGMLNDIVSIKTSMLECKINDEIENILKNLEDLSIVKN